MEAFSKKTRAARTKVYLLLAIVAVLGICTGFGTYTFTYAQGFSYFSNDPRACMNCHIMREQFDGWQKSPHHAVASCNDCHTPGYMQKGGAVPVGEWLTGTPVGYQGPWGTTYAANLRLTGLRLLLPFAISLPDHDPGPGRPQ